MKHVADDYAFLNRWYSSPQGLDIGVQFCQKLYPFKSILHGERAIQIGAYEKLPLLEALTYQHKWYFSPQLSDLSADFFSDFNTIPLQRHSVNAIFSPLSLNTLDASQWPLDILDYILQPMGYIIIFAINPYSLWGGALKYGLLPCLPNTAHSSMPIFKIQNALKHRGYTQLHLEHFYFLPPVSSLKWLNRLAFLNQMGHMLPLNPAAFYLLVMKKYEPKPRGFRLETIPSSVSMNSCF